MAAVTPPAIQLEHVTKTFGSVHAVRGVDLTINVGEVVAVLGPNGAGKTTTLDMVLGLSQPTAGTVTIAGASPRAAVDAGHVAAITQTGGLLNDITAADHVRLIAALFGVGRARADAVIQVTGLGDFGKRRVQSLSGGEKQRVKFAMALVSDPSLLILDEPTTGMDVGARRDFWRDIHAQAAEGRTVVFATHYLEEADEFADRVVLIDHGQVIADGTTAEIRSLVAGRVVTADLDSAEAAQAAATALGALGRATVQGPQISVQCRDSDAVVKQLFATTAAHDVLVTAQGLEEAFLALTGAAADGSEVKP